MFSSYKSASLLDETTEYHSELREFFASRSIQTGHIADLPGFLDRLQDPELRDEVGCLLRSIVFREEGEIASSYLLTILEEAVGGPEALTAQRVSPVVTQRLLTLIAQATHGLGSSLAHTPYPDEPQESEADSQSPDEPLRTPTPAALSSDPAAEPAVDASDSSAARGGVVPFLQRYYWVPAGAVSVLAAVLCILLPRSEDRRSSPPAPIRMQRADLPVIPYQHHHTEPISRVPVRPRKGVLLQHHTPVISDVRAPLRARPMEAPRITAPHAPSPSSLYPSARTEPAAKILFATSGLVASHLLYAPAPQYPASAEAQHLQGTVLLRLLIDRAGTVASTQILRGSAPFAAAAVRAVQNWRYKPFVTDGTAEVATLVTITFRLPV